MKWVFIFNEKLKIKIDKIQQKLKWGHYILQSTRKLTKSTDQRRIYDVNRISTSKNKKVSENFGTEILSTEILSTEFSEIFLFKTWFLEFLNFCQN